MFRQCNILCFRQFPRALMARRRLAATMLRPVAVVVLLLALALAPALPVRADAQDDCGLGGDIDEHPDVVFDMPFHCRAQSGGDGDTFRFQVPERSRVALSFRNHTGAYLFLEIEGPHGL